MQKGEKKTYGTRHVGVQTRTEAIIQILPDSHGDRFLGRLKALIFSENIP